jgi:hypothetical protein
MNFSSNKLEIPKIREIENIPSNDIEYVEENEFSFTTYFKNLVNFSEEQIKKENKIKYSTKNPTEKNKSIQFETEKELYEFLINKYRKEKDIVIDLNDPRYKDRNDYLWVEVKKNIEQKNKERNLKKNPLVQD